MMNQTKSPFIFTDLLRACLKSELEMGSKFLLDLGLTPDMVTLAGLGGHIAAAAVILGGNIQLGGLLLAVFAPLDALDGTMARRLGQPTPFGSFLDSVTDRYAEFILWGGLLGYFQQQQDWLTCLAVFGAAAGSALVPYMRAKAEALGFTAKVGILSRVERYVLLIPLLLLGQAQLAVWAIAVLANITAVQRIVYVKKESEWKTQS